MTDRFAMTRRAAVVLAAVSCIVATSRADAQIVSGTASSISEQFMHLSWSLSGDTTDLTVTQWYVPVVVRSGFAEDWELAIYSAVSGSSADWDVTDGDITGANDSRIQVAHSMAGDQLMISGGVSLPTGKTELSSEHRLLIPWLSSDFLNFPVKYPGEGLNIFGELATAVPAGAWVLGLAGAVHYAGEYTPFADGRSYQPGTRIVGTAGLQRDWPSRGRISADLVVIHSTEDKSEGRPVFADGLQIDLRLNGRRTFASGHIDVSGRAIMRGKNKVIDLGSVDLIQEQSNTNGSDMRVHVSGHRKLGQSVEGWVSLDAKFFAANEYAPDDPSGLFEDAAQVMGFGGGFDLSLGKQVTIGLGIRSWTGSSDGSARFEALDLSGLEVQQRLTITL